MTFGLITAIMIRLSHASVAQSVVHLTRNEKVACSSQVTSSTKTAVFLLKTAVFLTFCGGLRACQIGLALIWRYFFEGLKILKKQDFGKRNFPNFFEVISFLGKTDTAVWEKMIIPKTWRILNFLRYFCFTDNMTISVETTTFQKIAKVTGLTFIWRYFL